MRLCFSRVYSYANHPKNSTNVLFSGACPFLYSFFNIVAHPRRLYMLFDAFLYYWSVFVQNNFYQTLKGE